MNVVSWLKELRRCGDEQGTVLPLVALIIVLLMGFVALGVDWGRMTQERRNLQNIADAAALAGARELPDDTAAYSKATEYLTLNNLDPSAVVQIDFYRTFSDDQDDTIRVTINHTINNLFAGVIGQPQTLVPGVAVAVAGSLSGPMLCTLPIAGTYGMPDGPTLSHEGDYHVYELDEWQSMNPTADIYNPGQSDYRPALQGQCPDPQQVVTGDDYHLIQKNWGAYFVADMFTRFGYPFPDWTNDPITNYAHETTISGKLVWVPNNGLPWDQQSKRFTYVPIFDAAAYSDCLAQYGDIAACQMKLQGLAMAFMTWVGCRVPIPNTDPVQYDIVPLWAPGVTQSTCAPGDDIIKLIYIKPYDENGSFGVGNLFGPDYERLWK